MLESIVELYQLMEFVLFKGGWVILIPTLLWMFKIVYIQTINRNWYATVDWVFLKVTVPPENEKSPLAFEQILNQMHAMHTNHTWAETYLEGEVQIFFTWEVTSIGGKIGNYVRIPSKYRDTLEAAIYSQHPEAEIEETDDYFEHLPKYDPDTSDYDIFAWTFKPTKEDAYPIRTYLDFEHPTADTFVDPMTGAWEAMNSINEYEMFVIQYLMRPTGNDWKSEAELLVQKLKGVPSAKRRGKPFLAKLIGNLLTPFFDIVIGSTEPNGKPVREEPPSLMLHLSEGEKDVIGAIERSISKWGYSTKIRCLYLAPQEKFNRNAIVPAVIGAFKGTGSHQLNSLKPDLSRWTKANYFVFQKWEKGLTEFRTKWRKRRLMKDIRTRYFFFGPKPYVLNVEELATILHFPKMDVTVPEIEKVGVTKVQPPPELPVSTKFEQN